MEEGGPLPAGTTAADQTGAARLTVAPFASLKGKKFLFNIE